MFNTNDQKSAELRARLVRQQEQRQREEEEWRLADKRLRTGVEAERELLRQIAAEEEQEHQDMEVQRLVEELEVLRRTEAEEVRRVQSTSDQSGGDREVAGGYKGWEEVFEGPHWHLLQEVRVDQVEVLPSPSQFGMS